MRVRPGLYILMGIGEVCLVGQSVLHLPYIVTSELLLFLGYHTNTTQVCLSM